MIVNHPQPSPAPPLSAWDRFVAFLRTPEGTFLAATTLLLAVGGAAAAASSRSRRPAAPPRLPPGRLLPTAVPYDTPRGRALSQDERLAANREAGADFEGRAGRKLRRDFPEASIIPQLTVTTPGGKTRRIDYALKHPNGSVTAVEVKHTSELTEAHVEQAEDHRAGLHNLGVRAGPTIVMVPAHAVVREEHEARVRVVPIRKRARRG